MSTVELRDMVIVFFAAAGIWTMAKWVVDPIVERIIAEMRKR